MSVLNLESGERRARKAYRCQLWIGRTPRPMKAAEHEAARNWLARAGVSA